MGAKEKDPEETGVLARSTAFLTTCIDFAYACTCVYATHLELIEQLLGLVLPFSVGSRYQTRVISLGDRYLYPLSHLQANICYFS